MSSFQGADGFLDRFLIAVRRPVLFPTADVKNNYERLKDSGVEDFVNTYYKMYLHHIDGRSYTLSKEAQKEYDQMVVSYTEQLEEKYRMEVGK